MRPNFNKTQVKNGLLGLGAAALGFGGTAVLSDAATRPPETTPAVRAAEQLGITTQVMDASELAKQLLPSPAEAVSSETSTTTVVDDATTGDKDGAAAAKASGSFRQFENGTVEQLPQDPNLSISTDGLQQAMIPPVSIVNQQPSDVGEAAVQVTGQPQETRQG